MQSEMLEISEEDFRKTFDCLFQVKPGLSIDDAYEILRSTGFDVRLALLRLWESVRPASRHESSEDAKEDSSQISDIAAMEVDDDELSNCLSSPSYLETLQPGSDQPDCDEVVRGTITVLPTRQIVREQSISSDTYSGFESDSDDLPEDVTRLIPQGDNPRHLDLSLRGSQRRHEHDKYDLVRSCIQCKNITCSCVEMSASSTSLSVKDHESGAKTAQTADRLLAKKSKPHADTTVTKWIGRLAGGLFLRTLLVCGGENALQNGVGIAAAAGVEDLEGNDEGIAALIDVTCDPELVRRSSWQGNRVTEKINWVGSPIWKDKSGRIGYASAIVDRTHIRSGDYVAIRPAVEKEPKIRGQKSDDKIAAGIWFARLVYLFQDGNGNASAHIRYLEHGGGTILKETAGPRELFLLSECNDASLGAIAGKIKVDYVGRDDALHCTGLGAVELDFHEINHYFYRLWYSGTGAGDRFEDASLHQDGTAESGTKMCYCCKDTAMEEASKGISVVQRNKGGLIEAISHDGNSYSIHDFVYITPENSDEPYLIGQIMSLTAAGIAGYMNSTSSDKLKVHAKVRFLERYDDLFPSWLAEANKSKGFNVRDDRRLYYTACTGKIPGERLDGRCYVQHKSQIDNLNAYKNFDDTFYVADRARPGITRSKLDLKDLEHIEIHNFETSSDDDEKLIKEMSMVEDFLSKVKKLRAMEVFAGAGGLTVGLDQSGVVRTEWAVEWDIHAAKTYSHNMPKVKLYNHDANILLQRAVEEHAGTAKGVLLDFQGKPLPCMPKPGEVEYLYGGPSCQDFSLCNRFPKANSIKNSLLATYLSYVDHYRPKYFLLENVRGLLHHRLGSTQVNMTRTRGGIEMGSVKFILRALTSLGYQAQFGMLQAAEHGTPQSRARVFFWGAAPGYLLPKYPEPTHLCSGLSHLQYSRRTRRSAPHREITVGAAITDLPSFEYKLKVPEESRADKEARDRRAFTFRQVTVNDTNPSRIGRDVDKYAFGPLSEYQRKMRQDDQGQENVWDHYTMRWREDMMVRILRIPMRPGANHLDLPAEQDMWCLRDKKSAAAKHRFYPDRFGRLDFAKPFQTCLTKIDPSGKNGTVLHPNQHRVLTVREQSRAMGFPDWFKFPINQEPKESYRQLGNAVPCPVGKANGRELLKVLVKMWWDKKNPMLKEADEVADSVEGDDVWMDSD